VILAWRFGTRLDEETTIKPKPMVEIGGRPFWHIISLRMGLPISSSAVAWVTKLGVQLLHMSDVTDMRFNQMHVHCGYAEPGHVDRYVRKG